MILRIALETSKRRARPNRAGSGRSRAAAREMLSGLRIACGRRQLVPVAGELIILVGLQASGKSAFYRERFAATHALVSKDLMPRSARDKDRRQMAELEALLKSGASAVVDNTNPRAADRAPLVALARRHGARVVGYFFPPDVQLSLKRNAGREGRARVPNVAIFTAAKRMERPSPAEGFDELYEVRLSDAGFEVRRVTS